MKPTLFLALLLVRLTGSEFIYTTQEGDSLTRIGSRFGVDAAVIATSNGLSPSGVLQVGRVLKIDNRHIAPESKGENELIVNVPQRMLFLWKNGRMVRAAPIAAGSRGWKTPLGEFSVVLKEEDPVWDVPPSIQAEMRRAGKPVLTRVLPGPANPLGKYWIGLSLPGIGIHGTNAPLSIYSLVTHGCMRVHPEEIGAVFAEVEVGMRGRIIYEPVLVLRENESVFVEAHPDVYRKASNPLDTVMAQARTGGFEHLLDVARVREVVSKREGIARDVTRR